MLRTYCAFTRYLLRNTNEKNLEGWQAVMITKIRKRDGREVPFNIEKIASAVFKAASATGGKNYNTAMELAEKVVNHIEATQGKKIPDVEEIQDAVEKILIETGHARTAKEFILYRSTFTFGAGVLFTNLL